MQQECIFNVFEALFPLLYTNLVQFMEPKMDVSISFTKKQQLNNIKIKFFFVWVKACQSRRNDVQVH